MKLTRELMDAVADAHLRINGQLAPRHVVAAATSLVGDAAVLNSLCEASVSDEGVEWRVALITDHALIFVADTGSRRQADQAFDFELEGWSVARSDVTCVGVTHANGRREFEAWNVKLQWLVEAGTRSFTVPLFGPEGGRGLAGAQ